MQLLQKLSLVLLLSIHIVSAISKKKCRVEKRGTKLAIVCDKPVLADTSVIAYMKLLHPPVQKEAAKKKEQKVPPASQRTSTSTKVLSAHEKVIKCIKRTSKSFSIPDLLLNPVRVSCFSDEFMHGFTLKSGYGQLFYRYRCCKARQAVVAA